MNKRIITWQTTEGHTFTRGFIFGNYGSSVADYQKLIDEAVKDFPELKLEDIHVGKVTESSTVKYFALVSFMLPTNQMREGYDAWGSFNFSYS